MDDLEWLDEPRIVTDTFFKLRNPKIVWIDRELIRRHFEFASHFNDRMIDDVVINSAGIISSGQLRNNSCNTEIPVSGQPLIGYRPPRYGRAAIVDVKLPLSGMKFGLLDVKGCGVSDDQEPILRFHKTGLLPLREAFRELVMQKIIEKLFLINNINVRGVDVYAILDLGFNARVIGGKYEPAGAIVRRVHRRPRDNNEIAFFNDEAYRTKLKIELVLRFFGITSSNPRGRLRIHFDKSKDKIVIYLGDDEKTNLTQKEINALIEKKSINLPAEFDIINVQLTRQAHPNPLQAELVDFGHYYVGTPQFENPLLSFARKRRWGWGHIINSTNRLWVVPNKQKSINFNLLGNIETPPNTYEWAGLVPERETPGLTSFVVSLARDYFYGYIGAHEIEALIGSFVDKCTSNTAVTY
ncbi:hypothetical protein [Rhizobium rhizogenes]|uniref:hypothetical protein n=1 Tax=Rhizobium rhizogenes TaxID=359 RepID=UPI001571E576|nr:hypothetical protein [Rhizobium rhizogenes]NTH23020.1 hypothetical protein [Rhizobium rhizogenes]NTH36050.1 hypothetical protein [Rhizobium rhizogenes]